MKFAFTLFGVQIPKELKPLNTHLGAGSETLSYKQTDPNMLYFNYSCSEENSEKVFNIVNMLFTVINFTPSFYLFYIITYYVKN